MSHHKHLTLLEREMNNPVLMTPSFREMETEIPPVGNR